MGFNKNRIRSFTDLKLIRRSPGPLRTIINNLPIPCVGQPLFGFKAQRMSSNTSLLNDILGSTKVIHFRHKGYLIILWIIALKEPVRKTYHSFIVWKRFRTSGLSYRWWWAYPHLFQVQNAQLQTAISSGQAYLEALLKSCSETVFQAITPCQYHTSDADCKLGNWLFCIYGNEITGLDFNLISGFGFRCVVLV